MAHEENQSILDYIKDSMRIDHDRFDNVLNSLIEASKAYLVVAGVKKIEDDELTRLAHFHFIQSNFKNGQLTSSDQYIFSMMYIVLVDTLRHRGEENE